MTLNELIQKIPEYMRDFQIEIDTQLDARLRAYLPLAYITFDQKGSGAEPTIVLHPPA